MESSSGCGGLFLVFDCKAPEIDKVPNSTPLISTESVNTIQIRSLSINPRAIKSIPIVLRGPKSNIADHREKWVNREGFSRTR